VPGVNVHAEHCEIGVVGPRDLRKENKKKGQTQGKWVDGDIRCHFAALTGVSCSEITYIRVLAGTKFAAEEMSVMGKMGDLKRYDCSVNCCQYHFNTISIPRNNPSMDHPHRDVLTCSNSLRAIPRQFCETG